jgi:hypothetical protein
MTSGKPLKVKYLTTINWKRSPLFLYSSYDPICSKRDFLWFDTTGNGKAVSAILEKRSRRRKKLYEAEFSAQLKRLGLNIKEDYFKITNLTAGKTSRKLQRIKRQ